MKGVEIGKRKLRIKQIIILVIIMLLIGAGRQWRMVEKETSILLPKGQLFNVNNHDMNIYTTGSGKNSYFCDRFWNTKFVYGFLQNANGTAAICKNSKF